jgi:hypothetical protein
VAPAPVPAPAPAPAPAAPGNNAPQPAGGESHNVEVSSLSSLDDEFN